MAATRSNSAHRRILVTVLREGVGGDPLEATNSAAQTLWACLCGLPARGPVHLHKRSPSRTCGDREPSGSSAANSLYKADCLSSMLLGGTSIVRGSRGDGRMVASQCGQVAAPVILGANWHLVARGRGFVIIALAGPRQYCGPRQGIQDRTRQNPDNSAQSQGLIFLPPSISQIPCGSGGLLLCVNLRPNRPWDLTAP